MFLKEGKILGFCLKETYAGKQKGKVRQSVR